MSFIPQDTLSVNCYQLHKMECSNFVTNGNRNYQGNYNNKDRWLSLGLLTEDTKLEDELLNKDRFPLSGIEGICLAIFSFSS